MDEEFTGWTEYHGAQGELKVAKQVTPDQVIWWKPVNYRGTVRRIRTAEPAQKEENN